MHNAPSVSYPVGRSLAGGVLAAAAWLLGALVTAQWTLGSQVIGWRLGTAGFALAAAAGVAGWNWWVAPRGMLEWDGQHWIWVGGGRTDPGALDSCLDLQQCLLLHFRGQAQARWLWLERAQCTERWDDLRRAVYSRARPPTLPEAETGAAEP